MRDVIWTAVIGITLAVAAVVISAIDVFIAADLVPMVLGCGLASIAFGLAGISDKLDTTSPRR